MELNLSRQSKLVPADEVSQYTIKVFGVGSVGSYVVKTLAKTGFKNIEVFDNDIVEEENIAAQAYDFKHINMKKVDALKEAVKESSGVEITTHHGLIDEKSEITPEPNTIYCCFFDTFEGRKLVFDKIKEFPVIFVDGRIGRYDMRHYLINCNDTDEKTNFYKSLNTGKASELICGEKASAPVNLQIAGKIVMNMVNYIANKPYIKTYIGNASMPVNDIVVVKEREIEKKLEELGVQTDAE